VGSNHSLSRKLKLDSTIAAIIIVCVALWALWGLSKAWRADIAYNRGKSSLEESQKAVSLNPREPIYYAQLGNIYALITTQLIVPQIEKLPATASAEIKAQAKSILDQYTLKALENINKAQTLNPYNLNVLKTKAKTELTLAQIDQKYFQDALNTLLKITQLSPTESINYVNVGILYQNTGQNDLAKLAFQKALELNPDFWQAKTYLQKLKP
jgi:tetratricopeptide (TPR) repeat protein